MNIFVEEALANGRFDLGLGIRRMEERLANDPLSGPNSHLRAYRLCRKAAMVIWTKELKRAIQLLLNTKTRYAMASWSKKRPLWAEILVCAHVLATIGQLYGIERAANDRQLGASGRQRLRQEARPVLEKLHMYLQEQQVTALPKSPLGTAIGYTLRNWTALTRYTDDARLRVDNNGAEQALRPIVLGRKNYLFAGSEAAAHRTAVLCSLVQTCKHLQIDPFVYLRDVIERVSTHPARLVLQLTPREWKRLRKDTNTQAAA